ncbi:Sugar phosphate permease [Haladaptatus litoreus]|uniref:Sugar phosphate permease n=1 Tax=Haladaptatus litoreus TaxID=553468 RepID=A0A1N7E1V3_9EURY|nr:MFS transporter [Haladaptatus litoreus]SIR82031.1 Sugar phosphate permease [Haladaptatus litoreus]
MGTESQSVRASKSWQSVATVVGWQTAASFCYYTIFAATGFLRDAFSLSETLVGVFLTAALLGYTLMLFPSGAAVDGFGEKYTMVVGLLALAIAAVGVSLAPSYGLLLGAGGILGVAYSTAMPASNRAIVASSPDGRRGLAMGLKQVGVTAGSGAASLVVTGVATIAAWQVGFWVVAALAGGYVLVFVALYDGSQGSGEFSLPNLSRLRRNRAYKVLVVAGLFVGASIFSMLGYTVLYVQDAVGASAAAGGIVLAVTQVAGSVGRVGAGNIADRLGGAKGAATVALGQILLAVVLFAVLAVGDWSLPVTILLFIGLGISIHGSTGVFYSCLSELVDADDIGGATAGGQTAINIGGLVAPPLFGLLVETSGYGFGWGLLVGMTLVATVLFVEVRRQT